MYYLLLEIAENARPTFNQTEQVLTRVSSIVTKVGFIGMSLYFLHPVVNFAYGMAITGSTKDDIYVSLNHDVYVWYQFDYMNLAQTN